MDELAGLVEVLTLSLILKGFVFLVSILTCEVN